MSNLQIRVISAVVLGIAVLGVTWFGGLPFRLLAALIAGAIFYEWVHMTRPEGGSRLGFLPEVLMLVFMGVLVAGLPALSVAGILALLVAILAIGVSMRGAGQWDVAGLAYAGLSGFSLAFLRDGGWSGLAAVLFLFAVVWATDIFAYFVGRAVGGPKLAPAISPGKTQSGALGGAIFGVVAGVLVAMVLGVPNLIVLGLVALALSVVSQAGDLFESWVKRRHGAKDSSAIIPGHGGVMDRVDGLVAAALALYLIGWMTGSADHPAQGLFPV
ncbi:phosphatidate cytidylyltransferase [Mesorhizobium retamae]|uniref:Phosphatidate cytidylyltransferase n=1 Tax=Mesorhizobium retamae TaxID=2912854 RepID=A0ABS9Q8P6_9HYPH|nr:phosphatidate cytidylyltransferase [Mesorhizobium sp. IRAMC:0171]MCG7503790.1 phosphatidate cytidylyltransferase [Mesorhizobium sp. IRAMC:0171]